MGYKLIRFESFRDERGRLVAVEENRQIPFPIRRVYWIYGIPPDTQRGFHAHRDLSQVAVALSGSCRFILDDGQKRTEILLDNPETGLLIEGLVWREMYDFSQDCVLVVFADSPYNESDYIREYDRFLLNIKKRQAHG